MEQEEKLFPEPNNQYYEVKYFEVIDGKIVITSSENDCKGPIMQTVTVYSNGSDLPETLVFRAIVE